MSKNKMKPNIGGFILSAIILLQVGCAGIGQMGGSEDVAEQFAQAQRLQGNGEFEEAVALYSKIVRNYPDTRQGANSQFLIGFIYANDIRDYDRARVALNRFLDRYSTIADSGLVEGARFELEHIGDTPEDIIQDAPLPSDP